MFEGFPSDFADSSLTNVRKDGIEEFTGEGGTDTGGTV